ncbi:MAG TPA: 4-carboxy-4-hydroxy-2-oxoadipate aldolase/oxaloacetate decarboxylase [Pseudolysinimonas sp.]|jgi:4-hydroxy-4-methyl-2-oxoglutarate aldolase
MIGKVSQAAIDRLRSAGTATVCEAQMSAGVLASAIKPLDPGMILAGPAFTVRTPPGDNLAIQHAVTLAQPGQILVIDAEGFTEAGPWGDLLTTYAQRAGLGGLVIDGSVRDTAAIIASGFPVFSRGVCIRGTTKAGDPELVDIPIVCGGIAVRPGDIVIGDADGVVVVPWENADEVADRADARLAKEEGFREGIRSGRTLLQLMGINSAPPTRGSVNE